MALRDPRAAPERSETSDLDGLRILVAARDKEVGGFLRRYLKHWKAEVRNTSSLQRVRKMALAATGKDQPFDIIVLGALWSEAEQGSVCNDIRGTPALSGTRFVRLSFERLPEHRLVAEDSVMVSVNPLRRATFLTAVAVAAGRQSPEAHHREEVVDLPEIEPPTPDEAEAAGRLILVAEDNATNQAVILRQLNRLGYAAEVADDGRQALEVWKSRSFALVLTDCHMPEMDGFQLTGAIREAEGAGPEPVPIIAITANALQGEADRCLAAGMDDYFSKPVELLHLRKVLAQWLPPAAGEVAPPTESLGLPESRAEPLLQSHGPVDMAGLGRLLGSDDSAYLGEMLVFFWESVADTPPQLEALARARDSAGLKEAAHAAKGAARSATAVALAAALQDLETAAVAADWSAVEAMASRIEREFSAVEEYIRKIAARQS